MSNFKDLKNHKFGRLAVLEQDGFHVDPKSGKRQSKWLSKCECGVEKSVFGGALTSGHTVSCGCYQKEVNRKEGSALRSKFNAYKHSANRRNISFELDFELFQTLIVANCGHCNTEPKENLNYYNAKKAENLKAGRIFDEEYHRSQVISISSIDRINPNAGYIPSNVQTLCSKCNVAKSAQEQGHDSNRHNSNEAFIQHCLAVVKNNFIIVNNELILKEKKR